MIGPHLRLQGVRPRPSMAAPLAWVVVVATLILAVAAGLLVPTPAVTGTPSGGVAIAARVGTDGQPADEVSAPTARPSAVRALRGQSLWPAALLVAALIVLLPRAPRVSSRIRPRRAPAAGLGLRGRALLFAYLN